MAGTNGDERVPTLEMRGVSKTFPGVKALNGVQLKAWGGEVLALMGENGAGKSTLMKVLSGAHQADPGGEILIDGQPVQITDPIAPSSTASRSSTRSWPSPRT
jgi:ribose transport system ATP-binding protein